MRLNKAFSTTFGSNKRAQSLFGQDTLDVKPKDDSHKSLSTSALAEDLPDIKQVKPEDQLHLFAVKLRFCCRRINFTGCEPPNEALVQYKNYQLEELAEFVQTTKEVLKPSIYAMCVTMFSCNVFRPLPAVSHMHDPEEDDPIYDPAWPTLKYVYMFFLRLLESPALKPSEAKKYFSEKFIGQLVTMMSSEDPNERENLKLILHRLYGRFLGFRIYIRQVLSTKLAEMAFEKQYQFPGATDILELMGSIVAGLKAPLKRQHERFLFKILLPLHFSDHVGQFFSQLVYCVVQFQKKNPALMGKFTKLFLKKWPHLDSKKIVLYLSELEELIDEMQPEQFRSLEKLIYTKMSKCIKSEHYQVAERALMYWENEYIVSLMEVDKNVSCPILLPSLLHSSKFHWHRSVVEMATKGTKYFIEGKSLTELVRHLNRIKKAQKKQREDADAHWDNIERMAYENREKLQLRRCSHDATDRFFS